MSYNESNVNNDRKISVIGLGYVGLPLAVAFAKKIGVIGFDTNSQKIAIYKGGMDPTQEIGDDAIQETTVMFTDDETELKKAKFHIICVPTPIAIDKTPDLFIVEEASRILGRNLTRGSIVVYESTVYPGVTEDICVPILEKESGLKCGPDFKIGYSPERINPGDKIHRLENIKKIVSGMDAETLDEIAEVYSLVIEAGVYRASSIKVAEAAKVAENSQRDINIAFVNELALVFDRMGINTNEVIDAMNTKWNALGFRPGLVGGHCIGVDPHYFIYEAERLGYHSQIIQAGRKLNDDMATFIADSIIKQMILANIKVKDSKIVVFGITFKENCPDIRNTKIMDIIRRLNEFGISPIVCDPWADVDEVRAAYGIELVDIKDICEVDCAVFAVAHQQYLTLATAQIDLMFDSGVDKQKVLIDIKGIFDPRNFLTLGYRYWSL